jgi:hypothetical protein
VVVGDKGEVPKLFTPPACECMSQPTNVTALPPPADALMVVASLAVLLTGFASPPPETVAVFVTLAGALEETFTLTTMGG